MIMISSVACMYMITDYTLYIEQQKNYLSESVSLLKCDKEGEIDSEREKEEKERERDGWRVKKRKRERKGRGGKGGRERVRMCVFFE